MSDERSINDLIAGELSAIRQAVEARGPVDVDALARRVNELSRMDSEAVLRQAQDERGRQAQEAGQLVRRGVLVGQSPERGRLGQDEQLIHAPGSYEGTARVHGGKFDGLAVDDVVFVRNFLVLARAANPATVQPPSAELEGIARRALSGTGSGAGAEYVPTGMATQLWSDAFLASKIVASMQRIPMPVSPFDMPLGWGAVTWRKGTRNVQTTPSDPPTAKGTLTATEQVVEVDWDYTLDEDSIVAVLPTLRAELARSAGEQMDAFVLNADSETAATGNVNSDDAAPASDAYYLADGQNGIRRLYLVDATGQSTNINAALSDAHVLAGLARMGKYAADPSRLLLVTDAKTYINGFLALTNARTRDKFGPDATVLTGQLAQYSGVPIVVSESAGLTKSNGKVSVTPGNNVYGQISIVHRDMWRVGFRREILVEIDRDVKKRQFVMVVSFRIAVGSRGTRSTSIHTAGIHDIVV